ncbi:MAG: MGMT family protein [Caldisericaceae bacterium]|nr:MGMT family protein [Caldisericaceae bacterium]
MVCVNLFGIPLEVYIENGVILKIDFVERCSKSNKLFENELKSYWKNGQGALKYVLDVNSNLALVYRKTAEIPFGRVISYGGLSEAIFGTKKYARFIGYAMKKNPLPIIIPCHRVVRSDGTIGGFGGGVKTKGKLLSLEGVQIKNGRIPKSYFTDL